MSRQSVYEGLKTAIQYNGLPYDHFEDDYCTITFSSWDEFDPFDHLLDSLPMPNDFKLNIYAEEVAGRTDGVAVTVSNSLQKLGYWDMYNNMKAIVSTFESLISIILRSGIQLLDFDYDSLFIAIDRNDYENLSHLTIPHFIGKWRGKDGREGTEIHLNLNAF